MRATIKEKREVAKGTLLVLFDLLGEEFEYRPGQYFWVELLEPPYEDEKGPRRHLSAVTSPSERRVIGLCTRLRDSAFKRSLAELPVGAAVEVEPPKGKFVLPEDASRPLVFVAGGIGPFTRPEEVAARFCIAGFLAGIPGATSTPTVALTTNEPDSSSDGPESSRHLAGRPWRPAARPEERL
jgi:hypothetical protein